MAYVFWPYDEVKFDVDRTTKRLRVKAPWLELKATLGDADEEKYSRLSAKFNDGDIQREDVPFVHQMVKPFQKFPVCYILPTAKSGATDEHAPAGVGIEGPHVKPVVAAAIAGEAGPVDADAVVAQIARPNFEWDLESALQFAAVKEGIHPESLFSVARRYHILDVMESDRGSEVFAEIEALPPAERADGVALLVRQNHYVTTRCGEALRPALEKAQSAAEPVREFIRAEHGHDRILAAALREFTPEPESIPVIPQTIALMNLLKLAAEKNFLAFAIAVDFFERSSYEETDPLALLLTKAGFAHAAKQIDRHKAINDAGEHENVACGFLAQMKPVSAEYAVEAMRLAETISLVMNSVTKAAALSLRKVS